MMIPSMEQALRPRPRRTAQPAMAGDQGQPQAEPYFRGGTDVENKSGGSGRSYGEMTPAEFNQEA